MYTFDGLQREWILDRGEIDDSSLEMLKVGICPSYLQQSLSHLQSDQAQDLQDLGLVEQGSLAPKVAWVTKNQMEYNQ